jgi:hypothetical protein
LPISVSVLSTPGKISIPESARIHVNIATALGSDLALIDVMHKTLEYGKKPVKVGTGRFLFGV